MKTKITKKKKQTRVTFEDKFLDEQKYAEQNFHLVDTEREVPEYADEKGLITATDDLSNENEASRSAKKKK